MTVITRDNFCITCGYNLRTLAIDGRCPECHVPVADSAVPEGHRHVSRSQLQRIRTGTWLLLLALVLEILLDAIIKAGFRHILIMPSSEPLYMARSLLSLIVGAIQAAAIILAFRAMQRSASRSIYRLATLGIGLAVIGLLGTCLLSSLVFTTVSLDYRPEVWVTMWFAIVLLPIATFLFCLCLLKTTDVGGRLEAGCLFVLCISAAVCTLDDLGWSLYWLSSTWGPPGMAINPPWFEHYVALPASGVLVVGLAGYLRRVRGVATARETNAKSPPKIRAT